MTTQITALLEESLENLQSTAVEYGIDPYLSHTDLITALAQEMGINIQEETSAAKPTESAQKKENKKRRRKKKKRDDSNQTIDVEEEKRDDLPPVEIEYVPEQIQDPLFENFADVFAKFQPQEEEEVVEEAEQPKEDSDDDMDITDDDEDQTIEQKPSKKKLRKMTRLSVAELKQVVRRPDAVEVSELLLVFGLIL